MSTLKKIIPKTANKAIQLRRVHCAKQEGEDKNLRDHLQAEIESKTKACSNNVSCFDFYWKT